MLRGDAPVRILEVSVSARSIFTAAVVALVVVIGYDQYKQRKG